MAPWLWAWPLVQEPLPQVRELVPAEEALVVAGVAAAVEVVVAAVAAVGAAEAEPPQEAFGSSVVVGAVAEALGLGQLPMILE